MKKNIKKLRRVRDAYCYGNFFIGRGLSMISIIYQIVKYTAFAGIIVGMINETFGYTVISMDKVFYFVPVAVIILFFLGVFDVKYLHTLQKEREIDIKHHPYLVSLIKGEEYKEDEI